MQQLALQVLKPLFRMLALGQIADEPGEQAPAIQIAERGTRAASARTESAASWPRHRRARRLSSGGRTGVVARTAAA